MRGLFPSAATLLSGAAFLHGRGGDGKGFSLHACIYAGFVLYGIRCFFRVRKTAVCVVFSLAAAPRLWDFQRRRHPEELPRAERFERRDFSGAILSP